MHPEEVARIEAAHRARMPVAEQVTDGRCFIWVALVVGGMERRETVCTPMSIELDTTIVSNDLSDQSPQTPTKYSTSAAQAPRGPGPRGAGRRGGPQTIGTNRVADAAGHPICPFLRLPVLV